VVLDEGNALQRRVLRGSVGCMHQRRAGAALAARRTSTTTARTDSRTAMQGQPCPPAE